MAESSATQVILTDDGIKIIKAQSTADNAVGGVNNLNDPNLMSVIEKQTTSKQYAGLTSQYNVILSRAKEDNISTTALTTAYTNLNNFMTPLLKDTTKASKIDRYTYNSLTYAYNTALSNVQAALKDAYNTDISNMYTSVAVASQAASSAAIVASQAATTGDNASHAAEQARIAASQAQIAGDNATSVANNASQAASGAVIAGSQAAVKADKASTAASQAQIAGDNATSVANNATSIANSATSTADNALSQAQVVGSQASSEIAVQSTATAKAQSTADSAFSQAQAVGSQASADIVVQSTATAKAQSTADSAFSQAVTAIDTGQAVSQAVTALKDGSTLTIAELGNGLATKVSNSEYASYKDQTASQIGQLVTNSAFSAYQQTTADLIASKVATKDFSAYQATTAKSIESKVESSDFNTYKTQTADLIDDKVSSSEYASDKTQTASQISQMVSNSAFSAYQTQTASQIASKVDNGDFSTYKTQTADLISSKVATSDFSSYKDQTATAINSKVESSDFNTYKTQTADLISSKVSTVDFNNLKISNRNLALGTATSFTMTGNNTVNQSQNAYQFSRVIPDRTLVTVTFDIASSTGVGTYTIQFDGHDTGGSWQTITTGSLVNGTKHVSVTITTIGNNLHLWQKLDNATGTITISNFIISESSKEVDWTPAPEDQATQSDITQAVNNIHLGFKNPDGSTFQMNLSADGVALMDFSKIILNGTTNIANGTIGTAQIADAAITNAKIGKLAVGTAQIADGAITNAQIGSLAVGTAQIKDAAINSAKIASLAVGTAQIGDGAITNAKIGKLAVGTAQIANAAITDAKIGNISANHLTAGTIDFNTITGKNINASNITTGTMSTDRLNVGKLSALSANLGNVTTGSLKGVDIVANTFSTPNGSFTTDANGTITAKNMTLTGGTFSSPTINASTINGSTINGTTFHGGDIISNANNTAGYYPMTITPDGSYKSTYFDSAVGLQSSVESGAISYKYRSMIGSNGQYLSYDSVINGQGFESHSGYTSVKDTTFSNTETITGYVNVTPSTGIYLYGPTQKINFAGNADNIGSDGITMDSYGNIYGQNNSAYWRIRDSNGNNIVDFGTDIANQRGISLYRDTQIGNLFLGVGHTIGMVDKQPLYFKQGDSRGNMLDIKAGAVYYTSLVKSSLLSVKRDVQKANTAYWAQLVNSIDLATYQYKTDDNTSHIRLSSIVDDVNDTKQWQLPDVFISRDEDGKLCGVDDSVLLNATLATVQEQQKEIDQLNGHNMELEARLNKLEAKLNG